MSWSPAHVAYLLCEPMLIHRATLHLLMQSLPYPLCPWGVSFGALHTLGWLVGPKPIAHNIELVLYQP